MRLNNFSIGAAAIVFVACVVSVTVLTLFGKDTAGLVTLIQTVATVATGMLSLLAASKSQDAHDVASDVKQNVNGRMTQLIEALKNSTPTTTTDEEVEDV